MPKSLRSAALTLLAAATAAGCARHAQRGLVIGAAGGAVVGGVIGKVAGSTAKGLIKVEGDTVTLIYDYGGGEPKDFEPDGETQHLFVLKKQKQID